MSLHVLKGLSLICSLQTLYHKDRRKQKYDTCDHCGHNDVLHFLSFLLH